LRALIRHLLQHGDDAGQRLQEGAEGRDGIEQPGDQQLQGDGTDQQDNGDLLARAQQPRHARKSKKSHKAAGLQHQIVHECPQADKGGTIFRQALPPQPLATMKTTRNAALYGPHPDQDPLRESLFRRSCSRC
jgi:hypothetical protein